jgi:hypothetical protein
MALPFYLHLFIRNHRLPDHLAIEDLWSPQKKKIHIQLSKNERTNSHDKVDKTTPGCSTNNDLYYHGPQTIYIFPFS